MSSRGRGVVRSRLIGCWGGERGGGGNIVRERMREDGVQLFLLVGLI